MTEIGDLAGFKLGVFPGSNTPLTKGDLGIPLLVGN